MKKAICKLSKSDLRDRLKDLAKIVSEPQYLCAKCGRAANSKRNLCKGVSI
jgi:hypothetical protein